MANPYHKYQDTLLWRKLDETVRELITNNDLKLEAPMEYVVGYICKKMLDPGGALESIVPSLLRSFSIQDGEVRGWIEQGSSIHIKVASSPGEDPVELTSEHAREAGIAILQLALVLEGQEQL